MDILRKEINQIYEAQSLETESLDVMTVEDAKNTAETLAKAMGGCTVITDASCDRCYVYGQDLGILLGLSDISSMYKEEQSSDEDEIYNRIHPKDLVEKRMLEYEFFKKINLVGPHDKKKYKAMCRIRIRDRQNNYIHIINSTQAIQLSPKGKIWLILCCYNLSPIQRCGDDIEPHIINTFNGEILTLDFKDKRNHILTVREKEILNLIKEGKASKNIADILEISVHTVNRHRQNIIEKLSVGNSIEAITAASSMGLL
ncbi:MAG: helix-turn-helix transcriptional regulator [Muribaculaceae bacterium]|nr:helix-turn-helix transcriptional regulator [Muribaculaceae bacterium]